MTLKANTIVLDLTNAFFEWLLEPCALYLCYKKENNDGFSTFKTYKYFNEVILNSFEYCCIFQQRKFRLSFDCADRI